MSNFCLTGVNDCLHFAPTTPGRDCRRRTWLLRMMDNAAQAGEHVPLQGTVGGGRGPLRSTNVCSSPGQSLQHKRVRQPPRSRGGVRPRESIVSTRQRLSDEQERMRLEGLRILARIIVRHYHAHPEKYPGRGTQEPEEPPVNGRPTAEGERPTKGDAA